MERSTARDPLRSRAAWVLVASIAATAVLHLAPYGGVVARPLAYLFTLAHEMGHGMTAMLLGRDFVEFRLFADGSGVAVHNAEGVRGALVAMGGLIGPAIVAAVAFAVARRPRGARWFLGGVAAFLLWAVIFKVRNGVGVAVVLASATVAAAVALWARNEWAQLVLVFVAVQLSLSVYVRGDYLFSERALVGGEMWPSDVGQIAAALVLPYWFWGVLCAALSAAVLVLGAWCLIGARQRGPLRAS